MFEQLSDNLQNILKGLHGKPSINDENIESTTDEIKKAFIDADVSLKAIKTFLLRIKEKAVGERITKGVTPGQQFIKIINDELISLLGQEQQELSLTANPSIILMLGLQGAGKTTTCAKLGYLLKKKNKTPLLVPIDLKRPAAIEQLEILGKQINIPVYLTKGSFSKNKESTTKEILRAIEGAVEFAKNNSHDVVILDSAGRLQIDTELMAELLLIDKNFKLDEKLLVVDSMTGQEAANIASTFNTQIGITGIILTKLDGDARGGAALSVTEETGKPIKLIGIGEKTEDLQEFHPDRMASRILGMGDVLTLVEKAQEKIQEDEAKELEQKLLADFNFDTFLQAQNMMGKLGNFSSIFNMMGMGNMLNQMGINMNKVNQEKMLSENEIKLKKQKALIQSMTNEERINPSVLTPSRNRRISRGAGQKEKETEKLVSEFKQMKKLMDQFKPMMGMLKGQGSSPLDMLGSSFPSVTQPSGSKLQSGLLKGFKQKKKK